MKKINILLSSLIISCSSMVNAGIINSYDFNGDYSDTLGNGVDLVDSGGSLLGGFYNFTHNQGLKLTPALDDTSDYAIEMKLSVSDSLNGWNKLIDFMDLTSDNGLYLLNGDFDFFASGSHLQGGPVILNEYFTVAFERSAGFVTTYFNDVALTPFNDSSNQAVPPSNILNFFEDDFTTSQSETFIGSVDFIRIHSDASTFDSGESSVSVSEPFTLTLFAFGLMGLVLRTNRKNMVLSQTGV